MCPDEVKIAVLSHLDVCSFTSIGLVDERQKVVCKIRVGIYDELLLARKLFLQRLLRDAVLHSVLLPPVELLLDVAVKSQHVLVLLLAQLVVAHFGDDLCPVVAIVAKPTFQRAHAVVVNARSLRATASFRFHANGQAAGEPHVLGDEARKVRLGLGQLRCSCQCRRRCVLGCVLLLGLQPSAHYLD